MAYNRNKNSRNRARQNRTRQNSVTQINLQQNMNNELVNNSSQMFNPNAAKIGDNFIDSRGQRVVYTNYDADNSLYIFEDIHGRWSQVDSTTALNNYTATDNIYTTKMLEDYQSITKNISNKTEELFNTQLTIEAGGLSNYELNSLYNYDIGQINNLNEQYNSIVKQIQNVDKNFKPSDKVISNYNDLQEVTEMFVENKTKYYYQDATEYDNYIKEKINTINQNNSSINQINQQADKELKKHSKRKKSKNRQATTVGEQVDYHKDISKKIIEEEKKAKEQADQNRKNLEVQREARREARRDAVRNKNYNSIDDKIDAINNRPKRTLKELIEYYQTDNQLELDHIIPDAHEEALSIDAQYGMEEFDMDKLHKEALKENKRFDREKKKEEKSKKHYEEVQRLEEERQLQEWEEEIKTKEQAEKEFYKNKYEPAIENARSQKEDSLNSVFGGEEYDQYYEEVNEKHRQELWKNKPTSSLEELEEQVKKAQENYDSYIKGTDIDETKQKELYNDLLEKIQEKENYVRLQEYERKRKEYRASQGTEKNIESDIKRAQSRAEHEKRKARLDAGESVDDVFEAVSKDGKESAEQIAKNLKISTMKNLGHVVNLGFAISDFKDGKEAGKSNLGAALHAGKEFALGEMLGMKYGLVMLAKAAPTLAVSAAEGLNTMTRSMNSTQRRQLFGDAQFMDTQQLATMRQSGMELAKMSQYNLQQTLMGNEAEYLHRL